MTENMHSAVASSGHEPSGWSAAEWASDLADLENVRSWLMWRFAPEDPQQYCKVDQACDLLVEVLLTQEQARRQPSAS